MKTKKLLASLLVFISLILTITFGFALNACKNDAKNDVEIAFTDKNNVIISDTEIVVGGINFTDLAELRTTDDEGIIVIQNLGICDLTFSIATETASYTENYSLTEDDIKNGHIEVCFKDFTFAVSDG